MYRIMLFSYAFPRDEYELDSFEDDDEEDAIRNDRTARKMFLAEFTDEGLLSFNSVAAFLIEVAEWADSAENSFACS